MDFQDYINRLYTEISSLTDAFCNGCEKCRTNEEAFDFLYEYYMENINSYMGEYLETDADGEIDPDVEQAAERYMFSMTERVIADPNHAWMNKKCVRFLRYFAKKMNSWLWDSEEARLNWEADNAWLGI